MKNEARYFYIFAHNVEPGGISGGETILIETFKRIAPKFSKVYIYTWKPGFDLYTTYGLTNVSYNISKVPVVKNFYLSFFIRTIYSVWLGLTLPIKHPKNSFLFFSSDFLPDALAVILLKLRYKNTLFVSNFYLNAPNPFVGFKEKGSLSFPNLNGIFFWLMQKPVYWFSKKFADLVFLTSEPDAIRFPKQKARGNTLIVKGGVNLEEVKKFKNSNPKLKKMYDAVFMGRFHPQKGVVELITIWKDVVKVRPKAKLVMIGDGPLRSKVESLIKRFGLSSNISVKGLIFPANERYKLFAQSRVVVHPATYDSGGMSAAEAMSFGLPAISFDLEALKTYYPKGMIKVSIGDLKGFSRKIIELLSNENLYKKTSSEAKELVEESWDWDKRAKLIGSKILSIQK